MADEQKLEELRSTTIICTDALLRGLAEIVDGIYMGVLFRKGTAERLRAIAKELPSP